MDNKMTKKNFVTVENTRDNNPNASSSQLKNIDEDDDKGNMLNDLDTSSIGFGDKQDSEEEKEEDKMFGMGKNGELWQRSTNVFSMAKQR